MRLLCLDCREATVWNEGDSGLSGCPACGATGVPADLDDTVTVTLTTHELRVLTIWASNWAEHISTSCPQAPAQIRGILDEIGKSTAAALSLSQEIADLRADPAVSHVVVYRDGEPTDL